MADGCIEIRWKIKLCYAGFDQSSSTVREKASSGFIKTDFGNGSILWLFQPHSYGGVQYTRAICHRGH